jgi:hypothetical protein
MFRVVTIRCKGGSTKFEKAQMESLRKQEELQEKLTAIDQEFYQLRQDNRAMYDKQFRPLEESMLKRAALPATEATSAAARATEYGAADTASREALARRNERMGISNRSEGATPEDDYIRAIALTAVGNASKASALETQSMLQSNALGIGTEVNRDIATTYGRSIGGLQQGLGHADAAFANYANAQGHMNNAYLAEQAGIGSLIKAGVGVTGMGISNYQTAVRSDIMSGGTGKDIGFGSAFSAGASTWY